MIKRILYIAVVCGAAIVFIGILLADQPVPSDFIYGVSFSKFHADELKLDYKSVLLALLDDLKARRFRFSAHWPMIEPTKDRYDFSALDYQMQQARLRDAEVILGVGRRLPGWPECHEPQWASSLSKEAKEQEILDYIRAVVTQYKSYGNLKYWQIENEPFLTRFSQETCGGLDIGFLEHEIALVRELDPMRPIILTDGGEFGMWLPAWKRADVFGSTMYLYIWSPQLGKIRYPIGPRFFRIKRGILELIGGNKPSIVAELSAEPWLLQSITNTPIDVQLDRMNIDKFNEILGFSQKTSFDTFYLWGAEWWYWMKTKQDHPEFWNRARELFE